MGVKVVSKLGQALSRSLDSLSLADGSMLLRMRRASIALLVLVGAVGLGLIVFISQLGWPGVISGPLPGSPSRVGTVHDAVALSQLDSTASISGPAAVAAGRPAQEDVAGQGSRAASRDSELGGAKELGSGSGSGRGTQPDQGVDQPTAEPPPQPAAEPAPVAPAPTSAPTTAAVESPPQSSSAEAKKTTSTAKATETSVAKAVSDGGRSTAATATKSQGQKSSKDKGSSSASSKSSEASAKAKRDESAAKAKAPPVVTPEKSAPPTPSPAAAKEAADAAKSDQGRH